MRGEHFDSLVPWLGATRVSKGSNSKSFNNSKIGSNYTSLVVCLKKVKLFSNSLENLKKLEIFPSKQSLVLQVNIFPQHLFKFPNKKTK